MRNVLVRRLIAARAVVARSALLALCLSTGATMMAGCERNPAPGPGPKPISGTNAPVTAASGAPATPR
ncbi:hypothetical protein [Cupriavidus sp. SW-Y-13]|uniref:hypothetical protein n=1 Tax=Cupriavidus sp. SW-Y-13 TaxID=2653854 RepID=UPI00139D1D1C|nr:hypothetical protein [Cupriavidus sp. SW-Y-13]MWL90823.1 hypothetical protein [Cupriavidus sp. SW-Y-13]